MVDLITWPRSSESAAQLLQLGYKNWQEEKYRENSYV